MTSAEWIQWAKEGGAYLSPFLLGALLWMNSDRNRLIKDVASKDEKLESLSERTIIFMAELKTFLFNNGRAA